LAKRLVLQQQLKRLENCAQRDECRLTMKSQLIAIVAAVVLVGCAKNEIRKGLRANLNSLTMAGARFS